MNYFYSMRGLKAAGSHYPQRGDPAAKDGGRYNSPKVCEIQLLPWIITFQILLFSLANLKSSTSVLAFEHG